MTTYVAKIVDAVQAAQDEFIEWPTRSVLLMPGVTREKYHDYPETITKLLRDSGMRPDGRSNGPAICSYLLAGGQRPLRSDGKGWSIHHIYDGRFPYPGKATTTHAVKDGRYFTESAGLVAVHPIADALADEYAEFAWWLRRKAFIRFGFDPDDVLKNENGEQTPSPYSSPAAGSESGEA